MTMLEEKPKKIVQALIPLDGLIKQARWANAEQTSIVGDLYNDAKNRGEDGWEVQTSKIVKMITFNVALTQNSIYGIEWADETNIMENWKHG